jgi:hypothetical protein
MCFKLALRSQVKYAKQHILVETFFSQKCPKQIEGTIVWCPWMHRQGCMNSKEKHYFNITTLCTYIHIQYAPLKHAHVDLLWGLFMTSTLEVEYT